jgi:dTDP-glucose 4,6-dehydratase
LNILHGKGLPIYGDGKQIRDWLQVDDHSRGIDLIINSGRSGETYNIGGNNEWTNIDTIGLLCEIVDRKFSEIPALKTRFPDSPGAGAVAASTLIRHVADRPGHDIRYAVDAGKISSELAYEPFEDFRSGLDKTVDWYLDNEPWWQAILDGSYRN